MHLRFDRTLPCRADIAWSLMNDPRRMNLWSFARVEALSSGDGGHPAGVGALRRIHLVWGLRPLAFDEVVVASEAPARFVYRVAEGGMPLDDHLGRITLEETGRRTQLEWEIEIVPHRRMVGLLMRRGLGSLLERSLDRLVDVASAADKPADLPPTRHLDEGAAFAPAYEAAIARLDEQRELADSLDATEAAQSGFARVLQHVFELHVEACRDGAFEHPAWVLWQLLAAQGHYLNNVRAWLRRESGAVEAHWLSAFRAMQADVRSHDGSRAHLHRAVLEGVRAYVQEDVPRALADVWFQKYAGRCDYVRLRADYLATQGLVRRAIERVAGKAPQRRWSVRRHRSHTGGLPSMYREAFERGGRIAKMIGAGAPAVQAVR